MDEFLNRITAQRVVINIINKEKYFSFPLVGLSTNAIERWRGENIVEHNSEIMKVLYLIASKLFFLANKSQEQITNDYKLLSKSVSDLITYLQDNVSIWCK